MANLLSRFTASLNIFVYNILININGGILMQSKNIHQIFLFTILTYLLSWSIWCIGYSFYTTNNFLCAFIVFIGSCMPSFIGIILTLYFYKIEGLKNLFRRLIILKNNGIYCILGIIAITIYIFSLFLLSKVMGFNGNSNMNFVNILSNFIIILLIGGPLEEEFGWRGFLLDKIHSKFNICISSAIIGIIWSLWHFPLFFMPGSSQYNCPLSVYVLDAIFKSIIITIVFDKTNKCIAFSMILHAASNTAVTSIISSSSSTSDYFLFLKANEFMFIKIFTSIIILFIIIEIIFTSLRHKT